MPIDNCPADDALASRIWQELAQATRERDHAWRTPVLATVGAGQTPQARTVVLRGADQQRGELRLFTDKRSPKAAEVQASPQAVLVFWSPLLQWQLRVSMQTQLLESGADVEAAWERISQSAASRDYLGPAAPGQPVDAGAESDEPVSAHHLAILVGQVQAIDWLALGSGGQHQRRRITAESVQHLVP